MVHRFFLCVVVIFLTSGYALAEKVAPQHALIMHGAPKYESGFDHVSYANPKAPKGGHLKQAIIGSFDSLNNHIILGEPAKGLEYINDRLMHRVWDEAFGLYGLVAETIEIPEDRSWIIFNLNPNAKFHDGHAITAEDVVFSYEAYLNHGHPVRRRVYGLVEKVDVLSDRRIKFSFGEGYDRETALILAIMPVLPKHYWTAEGRDISKTTLTPPLGSGPYKVETAEAGRQVSYTRVSDYWAKDLPVTAGHYNFDRLDYIYYRDTDIALQAFKSGDLNLRREYDVARWEKSYDAPRLNTGDLASGGFVKKTYTHQRPERVRGFIFNTRRQAFKDIRVRQALSLAFDRQKINALFFQNRFNSIYSYFPNAHLAHSGPASSAEKALLEKYAKDIPPQLLNAALANDFASLDQTQTGRARLRAAGALLDEAGYSIKDGKRISDETGLPLDFEILLNASTDEKIALFFKNSLKRLGVSVIVRTVDSAQFTARLDQFDYDMVLYQWINSLSPGNEQLNYWGRAAATQTGSRNYSGIQNAAIDGLASEIGAAKTREDLVTAAKALDRVLMHSYLSLPLFYRGADMIAHDADVFAPLESPLYGTVLETWFKKTE